MVAPGGPYAIGFIDCQEAGWGRWPSEWDAREASGDAWNLWQTGSSGVPRLPSPPRKEPLPDCQIARVGLPDSNLSSLFAPMPSLLCLPSHSLCRSLPPPQAHGGFKCMPWVTDLYSSMLGISAWVPPHPVFFLFSQLRGNDLAPQCTTHAGLSLQLILVSAVTPVHRRCNILWLLRLRGRTRLARHSVVAVFAENILR